MRAIFIIFALLFTPALACDPEQPAPWSPSPLFEWAKEGSDG